MSSGSEVGSGRFGQERIFNVRSFKLVTSFVFAAAMVALAAPAAQAQDNQMSVSGGYQYFRFSQGGGDGEGANGFFVDLSGKLPTMNKGLAWGWLGELSGAYKDGGHAYTYSGGVRGTWEMNPQVMPFVQVQVGGTNFGGDQNSISAFIVDIGGGVKIPIMGQKFSVVAKVDYDRAFFSEDNGGGANYIRVGVGLAIPLPLK
jgi:hypothetical protein